MEALSDVVSRAGLMAPIRFRILFQIASGWSRWGNNEESIQQ